MSLEVHIKSNIEALSERHLHEALVQMVREIVSATTQFLRADRAQHSRSGLTEAHIHEEHVRDLAEVIEGRLGITAVTEQDERPTHGRYRHSQAPMFVDQGTQGPIFPARATSMWNAPEGIFGRLSVRGQPAQHFMLKTLAEAQALTRADKQIALALKEMAAEAAAMDI